MTKSLQTYHPMKNSQMGWILNLVTTPDSLNKFKNYVFHAINPNAHFSALEYAEGLITENVTKKFSTIKMALLKMMKLMKSI